MIDPQASQLLSKTWNGTLYITGGLQIDSQYYRKQDRAFWLYRWISFFNLPAVNLGTLIQTHISSSPATTCVYKYSYFPKTVTDWNNSSHSANSRSSQLQGRCTRDPETRLTSSLSKYFMRTPALYAWLQFGSVV